jgi:hypothetical protein
MLPEEFCFCSKHKELSELEKTVDEYIVAENKRSILQNRIPIHLDICIRGHR